MRFYTGIASVALFNTTFTLMKPYIPPITYWKDQNMPCKFKKELEGKKCQHH